MAVIGIDMDGVLADFNESFIRRVVQVTGEDKFPPRPFDIPCWQYPRHFGYSEKQESKVWEGIAADHFFWRNLKDMPGAREFLLSLRDVRRHDYYFITSRPGKTAKRQSEEWLIAREVERPTVIVSSQKGLCCKALGVNLYIDDYEKNCADVRALGSTQTFMLAQPWNQAMDEVTRVPTLDSFLEVIINA